MNFKNKIKTLITSPQISPEALKSLEHMGINVYFSCCNPNVLPPLSHHTDMQIANVGGKLVCAPECYEYYLKLLKNENTEILVGNTVLTSNYPGDIAYNIIIAGNLAIHNFNHTDSVVLNNLGGRKRINVSQGYTACTLCMLSENAFITSDNGIYKALNKYGADVLLTNDSLIRLDGFDHGFFGGSSVMISDDVLAVNGDISKHPDCEKIIDFCENHGVEIVSLSSEVITDIGSFIPGE